MNLMQHLVGLLGPTSDPLPAWLAERGLPKYRAAQIRTWLFAGRAQNFEAMTDLRKRRDAGKIRYIGISNFSGEQHAEAAQFGPIHSSQPRYNMFYRAAEESVLPSCLELGIGVIPHSPLAKGMLTGKYRPGHVFSDDDERAGKLEFKDDQLNVAFPIVERLIE